MRLVVLWFQLPLSIGLIVKTHLFKRVRVIGAQVIPISRPLFFTFLQAGKLREQSLTQASSSNKLQPTAAMHQSPKGSVVGHYGPDRVRKSGVVTRQFELPTRGFSVPCSTD